MTKVEAFFYDGKTSRKKEVRIHFNPPGFIRILGLGTNLSYSLSEVRIAPRVGNTPRSIYLPGGAKLETPDNNAVDAVLELQGRSGWNSFIHNLESRMRYVIPLIILSIVGIWGLVEFGIPQLAKRAAYAIPASADLALGRDGLQLLDQMFFSPSDIEENKKNQIVSLFEKMVQELADQHNFRLEFRKSDRMGPNALALPSGIIVVTDELVLIANHDNELKAVFAHEIGHVIHRHALRNLLQNSATVLIIASITGDITSITALSSALPTMLIEAKYSRAFEVEADLYALQYLRSHRIPAKHFADIILRMENETGSEKGIITYLSSHPATSERIKSFKDDG